MKTTRRHEHAVDRGRAADEKLERDGRAVETPRRIHRRGFEPVVERAGPPLHFAATKEAAIGESQILGWSGRAEVGHVLVRASGRAPDDARRVSDLLRRIGASITRVVRAGDMHLNDAEIRKRVPLAEEHPSLREEGEVLSADAGDPAGRHRPTRVAIGRRVRTLTRWNREESRRGIEVENEANLDSVVGDQLGFISNARTEDPDAVSERRARRIAVSHFGRASRDAPERIEA
jgi:hypothetical protein